MMRTKRFRAMAVAMAATVCVTATIDADAAADPGRQTTAEADARLHEALAESNDLRVRIVYSTELVPNDDTDPSLGVHEREIVPAADLVERARGATDPLVLDLMVRRCAMPTRGGSVCDAVDFARRWSEADTQNQVAWLALASVLKARGDLDGARATFTRAAQASSWHDHLQDFARVIAAASPDAGSPRARHAVLANALARAGAAGAQSMAANTLGTFCREEGDVRTACARIVATMFRDGTTLRALMPAAALARRAHVDPTVVAGYQQKADALRWSIELRYDDAAADVDPETADDQASSADNRRLEAMITIGERRFFEEELVARHVVDSDAAARYVATLSPAQLEQRSARLVVR